MKSKRAVRYATIAVAGLAAVALAGCSSNSSSSSGAGTTSNAPLTVWHEFSGASNTAMNKLVAGYNAANPKHKFTAREIANDQVTTVETTGLSGKNPPTVIQYEGYQETAQYAKAGELLDITKWWNQHKSSFSYSDSKAVADACTYKGKVYCIPWVVDSSDQLYYNPDLVKKYNITLPTKISDLSDIATQLKGTGVSAVSLYAGEGWPAAHWWYLLSTQECGVSTVMKAASQSGAKWDQPCFLKAATDLYNLGKAGVFPTGVGGSDYNHMMSLFLAGKTVFMNTGTWFNSTVSSTKTSFTVSTIPFPQANPAKPSTQILGGFTNVVGLSAQSGNTKAGYRFLDYMAKPSSGELFADASLISVVKGANTKLPQRIAQSAQTITTALDKPGDNLVSYFENLTPPTVGADAMYNGAAALAAGTMTPSAMVQSVQKAAAAAAAVPQ
jgi:raffinose/stachyose/melibiose transport system substrate-binding protein